MYNSLDVFSWDDGSQKRERELQVKSEVILTGGLHAPLRPWLTLSFDLLSGFEF